MNRQQTDRWRSMMLTGLLLWAMSWLLVSCTDDVEKEEQLGEFVLMPYSLHYKGLSRAITDDYDVYTAAPITAYMTENNVIPVRTTFRYSNYTHQWSSAYKIQAGHNYYIYGFTPTNAARTSYVNKYSYDYYYGAYLTMTDVEAISEKDLCVIVGIKGVMPSENPVVPDDLRPGSFKFEGQVKNQNFAYILLNHLYASLSFQMKVDAKYNSLRTIKLKKMEVKNIPETFDVTVTFKGNTVGDNPMEGKPSWSSLNKNIRNITFFNDELTLTDQLQPVTLNINNKEKDEVMLSPEISTSSSMMTLICTYDVYDKPTSPDSIPKLIRKGCKAENKLPVALNRGEKKTVKLTVNPTYLYVLSDPDLDNPTVKVEN